MIHLLTTSLQLLDNQGEFVPVTPIPGSIMITAGELMQIWTADKVVAKVSIKVILKIQGKY